MEQLLTQLTRYVSILLVLLGAFQINGHAQDEEQNIVEIAQSLPDFSILVEAVVKAELVEALSGEGPFTVFAPNNTAFEHLFAALGVGGVEDLTKEQLTPILLYHVLGAKVLSTDLAPSQEVETLQGGKVMVTKKGGKVKVNGVDVILADVEASNGVIHAIDEVLLPPGEVTSFTLINAATDEDVMEIEEGMVINLDELGLSEVNIRANVDPMSVGSVMFELNGKKGRTENVAPYALFGDIEGNYGSGALPMGEVMLMATPYSQAKAGGVAGMPLSVNFTIERTILGIASSLPDFSILVEAVVKAELVEALSGEGPFTVFAPDNHAFQDLFDALGVGGIEDLTKEQLTPILLYHVLGMKVLSTDLAPSQSVETLSGGLVTVTKMGNKVQVNGVDVNIADVEGSNGVIHAIDQVLLPKNIVEVAQMLPDFSILVEAVVKAELVEALSGEGPFTVFAPDNHAFQELFAALGVGGVEDLTKEQLTPILLYHVVAGAAVTSSELSDGQMIETLQGGDVEIGVNGGMVTVNGIKVNIADVGASNGVIHAIDEVLLPPTEESASEESARIIGNREVVSKVRIYPNPVVNTLHMEMIDDLSEDVNILLLDQYGRPVDQFVQSRSLSGNVEIDMSKYPSGLYLLKTSSGNQTDIIRLKKE